MNKTRTRVERGHIAPSTTLLLSLIQPCETSRGNWRHSPLPCFQYSVCPWWHPSPYIICTRARLPHTTTAAVSAPRPQSGGLSASLPEKLTKPGVRDELHRPCPSDGALFHRHPTRCHHPLMTRLPDYTDVHCPPLPTGTGWNKARQVYPTEHCCCCWYCELPTRPDIDPSGCELFGAALAVMLPIKLRHCN